jgi:hypothetical protein
MFSTSFTQKSECTLTKLNKGSKVDGVIIFTCSASESATATSMKDYPDALCIASKIAYNLAWKRGKRF